MTDAVPYDRRAAEERGGEQRYLDEAYRHLEAMTRRASAAEADAAQRAAGDWNATVAQVQLRRRLESLVADTRPLCFGRIDEDAGPAWHIGRRHVEDDAAEPVVVDWRAPVAVAFYRATFRDPQGLARRRRFILEGGRTIVDLLDEDFDDPATAGQTVASGLPDPLLAELGRSRAGAMHDIVATIAAEQDRIIRAPIDTPLIVQGGPGTGKTAVGLHRAAFLLYEHRAQLERDGVLVLGPNRLFLAYISEVLPSLGEAAVVQTTLAGLASAWPAGGHDDAPVIRLKGDARMAEVIARACQAALRPAEDDLVVSTRWGSVRLPAREINDLMVAAGASEGPVNQRRRRFRRAVGQRVTAVITERRADRVIDTDDIAADLRRDGAAQRGLDRLWPNQSAAAVVRALRRPAALAVAALGILSPEEQAVLAGPRRRTSVEEPRQWSESDLPLLDEAQAVLAGPPRRYGHVVVDEAQDLSAMGLRMVARRSADGRSLTILGDLAQATAPGATRTWAEAVTALGQPAGARVESLSVGYRVPGQIMELANRLLADVAPGLPVTSSVRDTDEKAVFRSAEDGRLVAEVVEEAAGGLSRFPSVAVISLPGRHRALRDEMGGRRVPASPAGTPPEPGHVTLLEPAQAKGLEFDAVVVVDPAAFLVQPAGGGLLYIALTRAVQHLSVVHLGALPPALADPVAAAR